MFQFFEGKAPAVPVAAGLASGPLSLTSISCSKLGVIALPTFGQSFPAISRSSRSSRGRGCDTKPDPVVGNMAASGGRPGAAHQALAGHKINVTSPTKKF